MIVLNNGRAATCGDWLWEGGGSPSLLFSTSVALGTGGSSHRSTLEGRERPRPEPHEGFSGQSLVTQSAQQVPAPIRKAVAG